MELTRTRVSSKICDTCSRKPCCLQGPRGFPGEQGKDGQPGKASTSRTETMKFSSGVLPDVFSFGNLFLGFGTSYYLTLNLEINSFQIPIPRDGILTNFTASVAQNLHNIDPVIYGFRILSISSSLGGTVEPLPAIPPPLLPNTDLTFPAAVTATPLQASATDTLATYNVSAGDRLAVAVLSAGFRYSGTGEQTFNASFDYTYNV